MSEHEPGRFGFSGPPWLGTPAAAALIETNLLACHQLLLLCVITGDIALFCRGLKPPGRDWRFRGRQSGTAVTRKVITDCDLCPYT